MSDIILSDNTSKVLYNYEGNNCINISDINYHNNFVIQPSLDILKPQIFFVGMDYYKSYIPCEEGDIYIDYKNKIVWKCEITGSWSFKNVFRLKSATIKLTPIKKTQLLTEKTKESSSLSNLIKSTIEGQKKYLNNYNVVLTIYPIKNNTFIRKNKKVALTFDGIEWVECSMDNIFVELEEKTTICEYIKQTKEKELLTERTHKEKEEYIPFHKRESLVWDNTIGSQNLSINFNYGDLIFGRDYSQKSSDSVNYNLDKKHSFPLKYFSNNITYTCSSSKSSNLDKINIII